MNRQLSIQWIKWFLIRSWLNTQQLGFVSNKRAHAAAIVNNPQSCTTTLFMKFNKTQCFEDKQPMKYF